MEKELDVRPRHLGTVRRGDGQAADIDQVG